MRRMNMCMVHGYGNNSRVHVASVCTTIWEKIAMDNDMKDEPWADTKRNEIVTTAKMKRSTC